VSKFKIEVECDECAGDNCSERFDGDDTYDMERWMETHVCDEKATAEYDAWIEELGAKARASR
jgi:hypothetical protein